MKTVINLPKNLAISLNLSVHNFIVTSCNDEESCMKSDIQDFSLPHGNVPLLITAEPEQIDETVRVIIMKY